MTLIRIGERALAPVAVNPIAPEAWASYDAPADGHDRLYFRVETQVYEALFEGRTQLTRAVRDAISKGGPQIEYDGRAAVFLKSEDMASASMLRSAAAEPED